MTTTPTATVIGISYKSTKRECWTEGQLRTDSNGQKYFLATGQANRGKYTGNLPSVNLQGGVLRGRK